ncbi:cytochrome P450 [Lentithecium fluviatile CBS 122367]|uniref:Cytochrome P450 n=1 Tax=Lentithecium fluviatile CBS 122367 TaxID=1168545 RepID=A0A6G1IC17_9PLEO|nr:cytochrome P450 [Lentithecium fluviatile CBS 122367]
MVAMDGLSVQLTLTVLTGLVSFFFMRLYRVRSHVRSLQKKGLPMPPHSFLFGHLRFVASILSTLPPHIHGVYIADQIRQKYPDLDTAFYLDIWPMGQPHLMLIKPDLTYQLTQANQLPKFPGLRRFLTPLAGEHNLVTMEGPAWKRWRSIFNPGFSASHISSLVPGMVDKVEVFKKKLTKLARTGELFHLEEMILNLTIDIIGGAVMDHDFQSQSKYNDMVTALRNQLTWSTTGIEISFLIKINFLRPFVHRYNTWRMNRYLYPRVKGRYSSILEQEGNPSKSVIDLALKAYQAENPSADSIPVAFLEVAIAQIKLFIFAGHDTTSSSTIFTFDLLARHPEVLARLRAEHDTIFGPNPSEVGSRLTTAPQLLNQLPYTLAVIKEALRIYPVVAALRVGQPGFSLVTEDGQQFPTEDCIIVGDHYGVHHNPAVWPQAETFIPERWIVDEGDPLYPAKNAWRPFERGPRNCIGTELAMTEIKIILAMTVRSFDIVDAYEEFDALKNNPKGMNVNGQRTYMVRGAGAGHPSDGYPCKVALRQ